MARSLIPPQVKNYNRVHLTPACHLALALEFQLGAIAVVRTALNFFLTREMRDERETTEAEGESPGDLPRER